MLSARLPKIRFQNTSTCGSDSLAYAPRCNASMSTPINVMQPCPNGRRTTMLAQPFHFVISLEVPAKALDSGRAINPFHGALNASESNTYTGTRTLSRRNSVARVSAGSNVSSGTPSTRVTPLLGNRSDIKCVAPPPIAQGLPLSGNTITSDPPRSIHSRNAAARSPVSNCGDACDQMISLKLHKPSHRSGISAGEIPRGNCVKEFMLGTNENPLASALSCSRPILPPPTNPMAS